MPIIIAAIKTSTAEPIEQIKTYLPGTMIDAMIRAMTAIEINTLVKTMLLFVSFFKKAEILSFINYFPLFAVILIIDHKILRATFTMYNALTIAFAT